MTIQITNIYLSVFIIFLSSRFLDQLFVFTRDFGIKAYDGRTGDKTFEYAMPSFEYEKSEEMVNNRMPPLIYPKKT